eukprot:s968_g4.t2
MEIPIGCEAQLLLEELDSTLAFLARPDEDPQHSVEKYTVAEILLAVPLLPSLGPTLSPKLGEDLAAFWRRRLLHYEATELPRSSQGTAAASWRAMPLMLPSGSKEIVIAATTRLLGQMSGHEVASVLVPLGNREGTEDPIGWFPIQVPCKTVSTSAQVADELEEMESHTLVPRYAVERLLGIFPPLRPSTAIIEMKGPVSKSAESMQRWGDRCCHLWQTYSSHRDVQSVELVVVLARSHGCGLLIFTGVRGFDLPLAKIFASRLSTNVASMELPSNSAGKKCAAFDLGVAASPPLLRANLLELLLQSAKRTPRSTAIAEMDDTLSYSELFSCAAVTASELFHKRKDGSSTAAVLSERSAAAVVGLVATLLTGAAYCPLIPSQPLDRLVSMISIASITEMLFQESAQEVADHLQQFQQHRGLSAVCIRLDPSSRLKLSLRDVQTSYATSGDAAMHVLFTSGSTGKPKVVRASHTAVMTHLLHVVRHHRLQATDVALQHTSLAWVAAAPEVWTPLLASAQLAVAPLAAKGGARDLETLAAFANRCTLQQYVPSVLQAMLLADLHPVSSTCHQLVLTGEPLPMELCHRVQSSSLTLRNHYGQTEAADTTTVYLVEPGLGAASVPLGRPATQRQDEYGSMNMDEMDGDSAAAFMGKRMDGMKMRRCNWLASAHLTVLALILLLTCRLQVSTFQAPTRRSVVTSLTASVARPRPAPQLGLGTSGLWDATLLVTALGLGYRLLDTAAFYGNEDTVGRAVAERKDITVTTKVWWLDMGYEKTRESVSRSLQRLGASKADLVLLHWPGRWLSGDARSNRTLREGSWKAMRELQEEGRINEIGVSNFTIRHLEEMLWYTDVVPAVNQVEVHPYFQQKDLVKYSQDRGISIQAYSPLASGQLQLLQDPLLLEVANSKGLSPAGTCSVWLDYWHGMCDIAELGELLVGGPGLHLDKEMEGSRLGAGAVLHTGDLARWVPFAGSMQLVCLGRKDRQVKVRGHRLELLEIEAVMKQQAESLLSRQVEALVTLCPVTRRLVAYVRPPLSAQETESLLKACQGKLLAHAVPSKVIGVEDWPRTSTGKVDRKALPQPETASASQPATSSTKMQIDASQYLQRSPVAPHRIREKGLQVLRGLLFGLVTSRASPWRMLLLPLVWNGWQQLLVPRRKGSLFAQDLGVRLPSLSTSVMLALLPWNVLVAAAALSAWRLGHRCCGTWMMWWMGLSHLQRQVMQDLEWYSWYLHPTRSLELAVKAFMGCKDLFGRLHTGYLPAKRPCEWDWDAPARRPRQRPRLDYVWVDHEPTGMTESSSSVHSVSEDLSHAELSLLEYLREEAGVRLEAKMPLATAFDSLRLTALVGGLRKSMAPQLTLRDALACDTVADLLKVISSLSRLAAEKQHDAEATRCAAEPHFFKVREWPYMFSLSVCWALESEQVDVARVQSALQSLLAKHGALCVKLADPPAIWDLAMEAAANLSLARALLNAEFGGMKPVQSGKGRGRHRRISSIMESVMDFIGWLLWTAWPRLQHERTPEVNLDVVECEDSEQLELRSTWLLDGRNGRQFLENPIHAVLLTDADTGKCRLHIAVSHGLSDGFSGLPLLQDFIQFYSGLAPTFNANQLQPGSAQKRFSGLLLQEARLRGALMVAANKIADAADIASWALPSSSSEGFDHFIWLQDASVKTLQSIVEQRMWCCSLDVAVLAALGSALARLHSNVPLRLRFVASARDQGDEGSVVADFADSRDLDLVFNHDVSVEDAARCIAECVRHRRWTAPDPRTSGDDRVYINVRPLFEVKSQPKEGQSGQRSWHHITQWPPVEGERNWDRRNVNHALWIMADQVSSMEWVFCLKIRKDRSDDQSLGRVLEQIIRDLALQPEVLLLPNRSHAVATKKRSSELPEEIRKQCKKWCQLTTFECHHSDISYTLENL